jgi:hypothetical protein
MSLPRLDAAPLLAAIEQERRRRRVTLRRLLGPNELRNLMRIRDGGVTAHVGAQLCDAIGRHPHDLWGTEAYEAARPAWGPGPDSHSTIHLPAAPLLAAIEEHPTIGKPRRGWSERLIERTGEGGLRAYERARRQGSLTLHAIEQFCDLLGWHPREVYGDAYDAAALAGCPAGFDPWEGIA